MNTNMSPRPLYPYGDLPKVYFIAATMAQAPKMSRQIGSSFSRVPKEQRIMNMPKIMHRNVNVRMSFLMSAKLISPLFKPYSGPTLFSLSLPLSTSPSSFERFDRI